MIPTISHKQMSSNICNTFKLMSLNSSLLWNAFFFSSKPPSWCCLLKMLIRFLFFLLTSFTSISRWRNKIYSTFVKAQTVSGAFYYAHNAYIQRNQSRCIKLHWKQTKIVERLTSVTGLWALSQHSVLPPWCFQAHLNPASATAHIIYLISAVGSFANTTCRISFPGTVSNITFVCSLCIILS